MDYLTITDLTDDQFASLSKDTTHRVALHHPLLWLWRPVRLEFANELIISTRYMDKKNPSSRVAYATKIPIYDADVKLVNLLWAQQADWFLLEVRTTGLAMYHHIAIEEHSRYKANALTVQLDKL